MVSSNSPLNSNSITPSTVKTINNTLKGKFQGAVGKQTTDNYGIVSQS